jgi:hypothetical protein
MITHQLKRQETLHATRKTTQAPLSGTFELVIPSTLFYRFMTSLTAFNFPHPTAPSKTAMPSFNLRILSALTIAVEPLTEGMPLVGWKQTGRYPPFLQDLVDGYQENQLNHQSAEETLEAFTKHLKDTEQ